MTFHTRRATLVGLYLLGRAYLAAMYGTPKADAATAWTPIAGATGQHYTPRIGDKGYRLRCKVIANSAGSTAMHTPQTNAVKGT